MALEVLLVEELRGAGGEAAHAAQGEIALVGDVADDVAGLIERAADEPFGRAAAQREHALRLIFRQASKDRVATVVLTLGRGAPKRLVSCPLDEPGYVVGNVTDEGYLTLRRVGRLTPGAAQLFDQQNLEGHRVTLFGLEGPVPGVAAVRSTHLTRGRPAGSEAAFTVDNAYVDVGAATRADLDALGLPVLTPSPP